MLDGSKFLNMIVMRCDCCNAEIATGQHGIHILARNARKVTDTKVEEGPFLHKDLCMACWMIVKTAMST